MKITDQHYYLKGEVSLFDVTDDMNVYHFTLTAELLYKPDNTVNQIPLTGIILYDNENSAVIDDNLNHRYHDLPENVRHDIRAKMMDIVRLEIMERNKENKETP